MSDPSLAVVFALAATASLAASWLLVTALERVGARVGLSEALLGMLAALAADAPEITAAVTALSRGEKRIGAGVVIGSNADNRKVRPKENGIGSKNLGLRTLFLFGDRIYLRSSGKMAVLDLKTVGTLIGPDPATRGRRGVSIDVPYRVDRFDKLEPFTVEREQIALDMLATEIPFTLVKLALPVGGRSLNNLNVDATRSNRRIIGGKTRSHTAAGHRG